MSAPMFFRDVRALSLADVARLSGVNCPEGHDPARMFSGVQPLERAGPSDIAYIDNPRYVGQLEQSGAGLILASARYAKRAPAGAIMITVADPGAAYAACLAAMHPDAMRPRSMFESTGISPGSVVHPSARLERGVIVDPGAVIGPRAEIGAGTIIAAGAVIGPDVAIGRDCAVASHVTVQHALIGNRVILHPGVRIGQDGFGFALGRAGHRKVAQVGRVIIQDDVEIGANTTVDRGGLRDTIIGEGTKIDNLVQIAHNVVIGRHCVIVSQTGIAGSVTLDDFVALGGQVGIVGHLSIGAGAQIAASSNVATDVPPGVRWGGTPAKPIREWMREIATVNRLARRQGGPEGGEESA
jgi:UDP-3-O-[3-hydroxymyristoyl] glucosamine N-acyltransferase